MGTFFTIKNYSIKFIEAIENGHDYCMHENTPIGLYATTANQMVIWETLVIIVGIVKLQELACSPTI